MPEFIKEHNREEIRNDYIEGILIIVLTMFLNIYFEDKEARQKFINTMLGEIKTNLEKKFTHYASLIEDLHSSYKRILR